MLPEILRLLTIRRLDGRKRRGRAKVRITPRLAPMPAAQASTSLPGGSPRRSIGKISAIMMSGVQPTPHSKRNGKVLGDCAVLLVLPCGADALILCVSVRVFNPGHTVDTSLVARSAVGLSPLMNWRQASSTSASSTWVVKPCGSMRYPVLL